MIQVSTFEDDDLFMQLRSSRRLASAAAIASEYNGLMTQVLAFGLATGVSTTRVLARQHFPSDVLAGSAVGWMIGLYVVHHRRRSD